MINVTLEGPNGGFHASFMVDKEKMFNTMIVEYNGRFYLFDRTGSKAHTQVYVETQAPYKIGF